MHFVLANFLVKRAEQEACVCLPGCGLVTVSQFPHVLARIWMPNAQDSGSAGGGSHWSLGGAWLSAGAVLGLGDGFAGGDVVSEAALPALRGGPGPGEAGWPQGAECRGRARVL